MLADVTSASIQNAAHNMDNGISRMCDTVTDLCHILLTHFERFPMRLILVSSGFYLLLVIHTYRKLSTNSYDINS